jgi:hypothetical protein
MAQTNPPPSSALETAVQDFDWTRKLDTDVRGLVTTWLEISDRAIRTINIVSPQAGA